ncbi:MAG TPA: hypothetical protein PLM48_00695 [Clostridia bacterium]|nr:hypothetical protein [Clostridia bacterium]
MNKTHTLRFVAALLLLFVIVVLPLKLIDADSRSMIQTLYAHKERRVCGTAVMYHIVGFRSYSGSVTNMLKRQAALFMKANPGMYIQVTGMSVDEFAERLEYGREPDCCSFSAGLLYEEQLLPLDMELPKLKTGLHVSPYAVPYFYSGYFVVKDNADTELADLMQSGELYINGVNAARLGLVGQCAQLKKAKAWVTDLSELGKVRELSATKPSALDNCTDLVMYLGVYRGASDKSAYIAERFFEWLLTPKAQEAVNELGAFGVLADRADTFIDSTLQMLTEVYAQPLAPDPFLLYTHKGELDSDAMFAVSGDDNAKIRFKERFELVYG